MGHINDNYTILFQMMIGQNIVQYLTIFVFVHGAEAANMKILQFGVDETISSPVSYASLTNHSPADPFPRVFTVCYRSKTMFDRLRNSKDPTTNALQFPTRDGDVWFEFSEKYDRTMSSLKLDFNSYFEFYFEKR